MQSKLIRNPMIGFSGYNALLMRHLITCTAWMSRVGSRRCVVGSSDGQGMFVAGRIDAGRGRF